MISIIAVLAAMLLPALSSARKKAHSIFCTNNLKQLGLAAIMYRDENDGWYVPHSSSTPGDWVVSLSGYIMLHKIWMGAPDKFAMYASPNLNCPSHSVSSDYGTYGLNEEVGHYRVSDPMVATPTTLFVFGDTHTMTPAHYARCYSPMHNNSGNGFCFTAYNTQASWMGNTYDYDIGHHHGNAGNFAHADGHAASHRREEVIPLTTAPAGSHNHAMQYWYPKMFNGDYSSMRWLGGQLW